MIRIIYFTLFNCILFFSTNSYSQDTNRVELHLQFYNQGICLPLVKSNFYSTSRYQKTKSVFQSGSYYSTIYVGVNSVDSTNLNPQTNYQLQSSSLNFDPDLDYELIILKYNGFNRAQPDSMIIKISELDKDSQLILSFKKGTFNLKKMEHFKTLKSDTAPDFMAVERKDFKNKLKLDSTAYFENGAKKVKYYIVSKNFPLYYVQEFDSLNSSFYSQGYHLIQKYNLQQNLSLQSIWTNAENTKYGYWEYFENGKRVKHEMWASICQHKFEWYPSDQLKSATQFGHSNKEMKHSRYLENGDVLEEYQMNSATRNASIKSYIYSAQGKLVLINTYNSSNGITKQGLQKRQLFYTSGQLKMEENYVANYTIKYYNEDGTERIN